MPIIERPIITEKSMAKAEQGVYTFEVAKDAVKSEIGKAITMLYGVAVTGVHIVAVKGKTVRRKTGKGKEQDWKKSYITVKAGQKIKEFELEASAKAEPADSKDDKKQ